MKTSNSYLRLVQKLPLTRTESVTQAQAAQAMIDRLLLQDLDFGGRAYLEVLTDLLEN